MKKTLLLLIVIIATSCSTTPWYEGILEVDEGIPSQQIDRSQPYSDILDDLRVQKNNISKIRYVKINGLMRLSGFDSEIRVFFINQWNEDDASKIADVVMKTLSFEPHWNDWDNGYSWTAGTYNVSLGKNGFYGGGMTLIISSKITN